MKLTFEPNLDYQLHAVNSIVNLFEGQQKDESTLDFTISTNDSFKLFTGINSIGNKIVISSEQIYKNLCEIQKANQIEIVSLEDFSNNDQLKTNIVLQFKNAGIEFKSV